MSKRAELRSVTFVKDTLFGIKKDGPYYVKVIVLYNTKGGIQFVIDFKGEWILFKSEEVIIEDVV